MKKIRNIVITSILASSSFSVFAQAATPVQTSFWDAYPSEVLVPLLIMTTLLTLLVIALGITAVEVGSYYRKKMISDGVENIPWVFKLFGIFEGDAEAFTGKYNDELIEGHEYDGIREFDNDLPPWWVYMFYTTIAFAVIYMFVYHVFNVGKLQTEEFEQEMELAELMYADVDEEYEGPSDDVAIIGEGKSLYEANDCVTCHRIDLGGNIGPNLTDECWKNGGSINEVYKTIKYGKGTMPDWQNSFSNDEIFAISSYVLSMQGSNPTEPKACEK